MPKRDGLWRDAFTRCREATAGRACWRACRTGELSDAAWGGMPANAFFRKRVGARHRARLLRPSHGLERNRLGRSGKPARLCANGLQRARSVGGGGSAKTATIATRRAGTIAVSDDPFEMPARAARPRARCVPSRWMGADARVSRETRLSTSPSSAPAQGAGRLLAGWPNTDSPSSPSMPVPISVRWRISPRTKPNRPSSTGPMTASSMAPIRCRWAATTAARRSADHRAFRHGLASVSARNGSNRAACLAMARTGRSIGAKCGTTTPRSSRR